ncbi:MAG: 2TM domain-containing protein [Rhodospirillales bacterium]
MRDKLPENANPENSPRARQRLRGLAFHLVGYFIVMAVLVPLNLFSTPENPWFVLPMVGWGSVLAVHVAWVMGLFDGLFGRN